MTYLSCIYSKYNKTVSNACQESYHKHLYGYIKTSCFTLCYLYLSYLRVFTYCLCGVMVKATATYFSLMLCEFHGSIPAKGLIKINYFFIYLNFSLKSAIYDRHNDFLYFNKDDHFRINRRLTGWLLRLLHSADECQRFGNCPNKNSFFINHGTRRVCHSNIS